MSNYNGNLKSHVTSDKIKWIVTLVAFVLVAVLFAGIFAGWFKVPAPKEETPAEGGGVDGGSVLTLGDDVVDEDGNKLSLTAYEIPRAQYEEHGVMPIAQTAYTLTATVNEDATVQAVDWTVEFQNPASEWASGKTVTEYVTVSSTGALTATVQCLKAFGEQILVSAVSKDNPAAKATCACDYQKQILGASIKIGRDADFSDCLYDGSVFEDDKSLGKITLLQDWYFKAEPITGDGTISYFNDSVQTPVGGKIVLSLNAIARVRINGWNTTLVQDNGNITCRSAGYFSSSYPATSLDESAVKTLFGSKAFSSDFYQAFRAIHGTWLKILDVTVTVRYGNDNEKTFTCTLDVDADSFYTPVINVQLDQAHLQF